MGIKSLIRKSMHKLIRWSVNEGANECVPEPMSTKVGIAGRSLEDNCNPMNMNIFNATGGKVIKTSHYDQRTDRVNTQLYIITDKEDMGEELALIITKEALLR